MTTNTVPKFGSVEVVFKDGREPRVFKSPSGTLMTCNSAGFFTVVDTERMNEQVAFPVADIKEYKTS